MYALCETNVFQKNMEENKEEKITVSPSHPQRDDHI